MHDEIVLDTRVVRGFVAAVRAAIAASGASPGRATSTRWSRAGPFRCQARAWHLGWPDRTGRRDSSYNATRRKRR
jgi:hypothetical protein